MCRWILAIAVLLLAFMAFGQGKVPRAAPPVDQTMQEPILALGSRVLPPEYSIELYPQSRVRPSKLHEGDMVGFVLRRDLYCGDVLVARAGTVVEARVTETQGAKAWGHPSKLALEFGGLPLVNGRYLTLSAQRFDAPERTETPMAGAISAPVPGAFIIGIPLAFIGAASRGKTRDLQADSPIQVFPDGAFFVDPEAFRPFQPTSRQPAKLRVVYSRVTPDEDDLYCNGVPIAHLKKFRRMELDLVPGYYRIAMVGKHPGTPMVVVHLDPGEEGEYVATSMSLRPVNLGAKSFEASGWLTSHTDAELMRDAKPVEPRDVYATTCQPLKEELLGFPEFRIR
jgi:hypothetical protein